MTDGKTSLIKHLKLLREHMITLAKSQQVKEMIMQLILY